MKVVIQLKQKKPGNQIHDHHIICKLPSPEFSLDFFITTFTNHQIVLTIITIEIYHNYLLLSIDPKDSPFPCWAQKTLSN